ncbi:MAG: hypothetical protein JO360_06970 [Acidobacteria bacterium]|nr:hypothetical protein [Acidobacteriota bacterium]
MDGTVRTLAGDLEVKSDDRKPVAGAMAWGGLMGLTVNAQGDVYVADYRNRRVLKVASGGAVSTVAQSEQTWTPTGVAAARNGDLYILEIGVAPQSPHAPRVRKISSSGRDTILATAGENVNPAASESLSSGVAERSARSRPLVLYLLLGAGASIFALTLGRLLSRRTGAK